MAFEHHEREHIKGWAFAPGASLRQEARLLKLANDALELRSEDTGERLTSCEKSGAQLELTAGQGSRNVTLQDGWLFQSSDPDLGNFLGESTRSKFLRKLESPRPHVFAIIAACLAGAYGLYVYALPLIVALGVWLTPQPMRLAMDKATIQTLDWTLAEPTKLSAEIQSIWQDEFDRLKAHLDEGVNFTLNFRAMPGLGPNAMALPGGNVIITDALLVEFGDDKDLVLGVLAHELGHVLEEHGLRQVYRSLSIRMLVALFAGDAGPVIEDLLLEGQLLLQLTYSREHELSADQFALELLEKAEIDPRGLRRFFDEVVGYEAEINDWLSTHPTGKERIDAIDAFINAPNRAP